MFEYTFMVNAFQAAGIVAVLAGTVGYFLVLRGQTFAGHALSHVGFAGATGAALVGLSPLAGMTGFTVLAAIGIGCLGERAEGRDVAIGLVLSLSLGLGLLFLHLYTAYAGQATALLFGNVLGVSRPVIHTLALMAAGALVALGIILRPLVFSSLQPEVAEAKGVRLPLVSVLFLVIVALAVAGATQIVGVLLVFSLLVGPAAAAMRLTRHVGRGVLISVAAALTAAWGGLAASYYTDWPASFWITTLSVVLWGLAWGAAQLRAARPAEA
ncbi:metal ABC transporter permease [Pseudoxanthobacter sp.]|uniref:metal ABC transporter permease n=1 Tax=Pseudoxanthobacter sp. TaxID=1925742 RepID=UPI002FDF609D